jgi:hypothetical protein
MHLRWSCVVLLASALAALGLGGCAADGAADTGSFVAVVPPAPVTMNNETYVTLEAPPAAAASPESASASVAVVKPPDPGCVPDDTACLEAACARGSALGCEARGDLYRNQDDVRALDYYRSALTAYHRACDADDADACAGYRRLSTPGYGAHTYLAIRPEVAPDPAPGPLGTTVTINGNHNVVQVFGSAAKVVGKVAKKAPTD